MKEDIIKMLNIGENHELECKLAEKGFPSSVWETYSSFANTEGGTILLGVKEHRDSFTISGLDDRTIVKYEKEFWSTINNRNKVNKNILLNNHVRVIELDGKKILRIDVPYADRHDKPIYIGTDPIAGTYRRNFEGDYLCREEEVRSMFADQLDSSYDSKVVENMGMEVLSTDTLKGYRNRFDNLNPNHPWTNLSLEEFLLKITALKKNSKGGLSPTIAGLLMFGEEPYIIEEFTSYFLDYREESDERNVRWVFRTTSESGDWSGNLFDFYFKVSNRIAADIAMPFVLKDGKDRIDEIRVHTALREAVVNALVHSNFYGRQGIVIIKSKNQIKISNPGSLRISKEEFFAGGTSDPRNPIIFKMFNRVHIGERAGSGVDNIRLAWKEQNWEEPVFQTSFSPERISVELEIGQVTYVEGIYNKWDSTPMHIRETQNPSFYQVVEETGLNKKSKERVMMLYKEYQTDKVFDWKDVMEITNCSSATAARLLRAMQSSGLVKKIDMKGKYQFNS